MKNFSLHTAKKGLFGSLLLLFPALLSTAQEANPAQPDPADGKKKTHLFIIKETDGKVVKTDTVFYGDDAAFIGDEAFKFDFDQDFDFDTDFDTDFDADFTFPDMPDLSFWKDSTGYAYKFGTSAGMSDEDKARLKEEMQKAREEMRQAREEMKAARHEKLEEEMDALRQELKSMNKEELQKEVERLQEELIKMKEGLHERHKLMWMDDGRPGKDKHCKDMRMHQPCGGGMKECLVIMDGDTIVCNTAARCRMLMKDARKEGTGKARRIRIEKIVTSDADGAPAEPPAPVEKTVPASPAEPTVADPEQVADRKTVSASEEKIALHDLLFYPNPSDGHFRLSFTLDTPGEADIRLVDYAGKEILNEQADGFPGTYSKQFDVSGSARGSYLLMIAQGNRWVHEKLVVN